MSAPVGVVALGVVLPAPRTARPLATWLARKLGCTVAEAEARLQASRRAAWRMTASKAALRLDAEHLAVEPRAEVAHARR